MSQKDRESKTGSKYRVHGCLGENNLFYMCVIERESKTYSNNSDCH